MSSPDQDLIDAARAYAQTTGRGLKRITLTLDDETKRKIEVHAWPPPIGWAYRGSQGAYNGKIFRVVGKLAAVLRELVEAGDEGIEADVLRLRVWDRHTEEKTMQNAVSRLRAVIREALGLADDVDPVESSDERYRLVAVG